MNNTIASERTRLGLSQDELAQELKKSRSTIQRWEKSPEEISGANLIKLSTLFGCSIDYLLGNTIERTPFCLGKAN